MLRGPEGRQDGAGLPTASAMAIRLITPGTRARPAPFPGPRSPLLPPSTRLQLPRSAAAPPPGDERDQRLLGFDWLPDGWAGLVSARLCCEPTLLSLATLLVPVLRPVEGAVVFTLFVVVSLLLSAPFTPYGTA